MMEILAILHVETFRLHSFAAARRALNSNWQWCFCFWHRGYQPLCIETNQRNHTNSFHVQRVSSKLIVAPCCTLFTLALNSDRQIAWPSALIFGPWDPWQHGLPVRDNNDGAWSSTTDVEIVFIVGVSEGDSCSFLAVEHGPQTHQWWSFVQQSPRTTMIMWGTPGQANIASHAFAWSWGAFV